MRWATCTRIFESAPRSRKAIGAQAVSVYAACLLTDARNAFEHRTRDCFYIGARHVFARSLGDLCSFADGGGEERGAVELLRPADERRRICRQGGVSVKTVGGTESAHSPMRVAPATVVNATVACWSANPPVLFWLNKGHARPTANADGNRCAVSGLRQGAGCSQLAGRYGAHQGTREGWQRLRRDSQHDEHRGFRGAGDAGG